MPFTAESDVMPENLLHDSHEKDAQRWSSGGAGGGTQPARDKASWEKRYPALTCNEVLCGG